jgi:small subunit ribosomal protein S1
MVKVSKETIEKDSMYVELDSFLGKDENKIKSLSSGDIVEGTIVDIRPGSIIVDVGYKSEGIVAGRELKSDLIDVSTLKVGDTLLVYVVRPEDEEGQLILSIRRTQQAGLWLSLAKAKEKNEVVEAVVIESNNGGLICELGGGVRGFIPTSQLDSSRVYASGVRQVGNDISSKVHRKLASLMGEKIKTRIIELDREKNRIILSEKMVTQAEISKRERRP